MIAVQGPNAREKVWQALPGSERGDARRSTPFHGRVRHGAATSFVARTGYTGEDGFEIMLPAATRGGDCGSALAAAGVQPCGLGARDTLRLEAGMNLYGQDMDETRLAARRRASPGPSISRARAISSARPRCVAQPPAQQLARPAAARRGRRAARAPEGAHGARRRRDHQRHVLARRSASRSRSRACRAAWRPATSCTSRCATSSSRRAW